MAAAARSIRRTCGDGTRRDGEEDIEQSAKREEEVFARGVQSAIEVIRVHANDLQNAGFEEEKVETCDFLIDEVGALLAGLRGGEK